MTPKLEGFAVVAPSAEWDSALFGLRKKERLNIIAFSSAQFNVTNIFESKSKHPLWGQKRRDCHCT